MTLFQALLLATSLGWTIVEASFPREAVRPAVGFPRGPKYGNNITSIAGIGTGLNVSCPTCPTYNSPRVESTQASLDGPRKPTKPSGPKITEPPTVPPHAETTPAASTLPRIPGIEQTAPTLDVPSPTGDSHERHNPEVSPLTSIALIAGTKTLTGTDLLSYLAEPASPPAYRIDPSHTILPGSSAVVISGTTYSAPHTSIALIAGTKTLTGTDLLSYLAAPASPIGPSHTILPGPSAIVIAGTKTLTGTALLSYLAAPASPPAYTIDPSHTILPGSPPIVIAGTTYSAAATGPELYANGAGICTTLPVPTGGGEHNLGEAMWSALGIAATRTGSSMITSTTTANGQDAERTGSATATESDAPLQTGGASSNSQSRILFGSAGIGLVGLMIALL